MMTGLLLAYPAFSDVRLGPSDARTKLPRLFARDARLDQRISLIERRVYLGELLDRISAQSGVKLSAPDTPSPISGMELGVSSNAVELRELMAGMAELLTYPHSPFRWVAGTGERPEYTLVHPRSLKEAALRTRGEMLEHWSRDVRAYRDLALLPEPKRTQQAAAYPHLIFAPDRYDWRKAAPLVNLTPQELAAILRSAAEVGGLVPAKDANDATRPSDGPRVLWNTQNLGPMLYSGVNLVGGSLWDHHWMEREMPGWLDPRHAEPLAWVMRKRKGGYPGEDGGNGPIDEWVERAGKQQGLNILAEQGRHWEVVGPMWFGKDPEHTPIAMVSRDAHLRRTSGLNLLRHQSAIADLREYLVSWRELRQLRAVAQKVDFLPPEQLVALSRYNPRQRDWLNERVPGSYSPHLEEWRPIFEFYTSLPEELRIRLGREEGLRVSELPEAARKLLDPKDDPQNRKGFADLRKSEAVARVVLQFRPVEPSPSSPQTRPRSRRIDWKVIIPGGKVIGALYTQPSCQPPPER